MTIKLPKSFIRCRNPLLFLCSAFVSSEFVRITYQFSLTTKCFQHINGEAFFEAFYVFFKPQGSFVHLKVRHYKRVFCLVESF